MGTIQIDGSTPKLTIGNATAEDATILFDGNAQDFYIALDDSADDLLIGLGSTVGTTPAIAIDENLKVNIPVTTASTSASTGSLTTGGGAGIGADLYVGDDVYLITDSAVLGFGADKDTTLTHTDGTGLTLNSTNKLCFNDASQFVQGSSNAILSLGATDEIDLTATAVDLNGTLDVSGTSLLTGRVGIVTAGDLGVGIHIRSADSGGGVSGDADELVIEGSAHSGITILSGASSKGSIHFGDSGDDNEARVLYDHNTTSMSLYTAGSEAMKIDGSGHVTKPLQPAFHVQHGNLSNKTGNGTQYAIVMSTENFDVNGDWSSATFTAPVTGKYFFATTVHFENITADKRTHLQINASNRALERYFQSDPESNAVDGAHLSGLIDMDASDTVQFRVTVHGVGADTVDLTDYSHYNGFLVC